jgi:ATP-dependent DNA helicase RecG
VADIPERHFEEYQELTNVSLQMATIDLSEIVKKNVFERIGKACKGIALID